MCYDIGQAGKTSKYANLEYKQKFIHKIYIYATKPDIRKQLVCLHYILLFST